MGTTPRTCFYVPYDQRDEEGYIPSVVTENEPGHSPMTGNGAHAQPWHWGRTYKEAERVCAEQNLKTYGLTEADAAEIVLSSMGAQDDTQVVIDVSGLNPGDPIPNHPLGDYVLGECGHGVAASEWRVGYRNCERDGG